MQDVRAVAGPGNASVPGQGGGLWPQLVMNMSYTGRVSLKISTKVILTIFFMFFCLCYWKKGC